MTAYEDDSFVVRNLNTRHEWHGIFRTDHKHVCVFFVFKFQSKVQKRFTLSISLHILFCFALSTNQNFMLFAMAIACSDGYNRNQIKYWNLGVKNSQFRQKNQPFENQVDRPSFFYA